jgi:hypothetical protein
VVLVHGPRKQNGEIAEHVPLPYGFQSALVEESSDIQTGNTVRFESGYWLFLSEVAVAIATGRDLLAASLPS